MESLLLYSSYVGCTWISLTFGGLIGLGVAIWLSCWAGRIAQRKGYSYGAFWCLTFFCGLVGIIVAACISDKNQQQAQPTVAVSKDPWTCTKCGSLNDGGIYCLKCGEKRHSAAGWLCMECLTYNDDGEFCSKCGEPKISKSVPKKPVSWRCEYCGRLNPTDSYQCDGCGSRREK